MRDVPDVSYARGSGAAVAFSPWVGGHAAPSLRLSGRPRKVTLEARMDDISAVLDAVGNERATLFGVAESANVRALFAATERCERLGLVGPHARSVRTDELEGVPGSWRLFAVVA